jgi:DNA polymerase I-like protein with 3'-5' exonuclease and polymerase domains
MAKIIDTADLNFAAHDGDETYWLYNGLDCVVTADVLQALLAQADETALRTYEFSKALQAPVLEMNLRGLRVNKKRKMQVIADVTAKIARLEEQLDLIIQEGIGAPGANWRSPKQLKELLYDIMGLPVQKKRNANGVFAPTTDEAALEKLANYFIAEPICNHILLLRGLGKSLGFLRTGVDQDGRMRTQFNIAGTVTGRCASSATDFDTGTNLQNVTESLRSVFVADPDMMFCNIDLEQGDSRNVGALCWNQLIDQFGEAFAGKYLDACESGDLHTLVTKMVYGDKLPWGTASDREVAEAIAYKHYDWRFLSKKSGHGSNYLMQPPTMAKNARCTVPMAKEFQEKYFKAFPCIPEWHKKVFWGLENLGYLESPHFHRRRFFFGRPKDGSTQREAVAHVPQSMTGDEINTGILNLWRADKVQLLVQVHDSILFQFPEHLRDEIVPWAVEQAQTRLVLERSREFVVPVEAKTGWNWGNYATEEDVQAGRANEINIDGLKKWKGGDDRKRTETRFQLSLSDF